MAELSLPQIIENRACNMPYQMCKASPVNLLTPAGVLATLAKEFLRTALRA